MRPTESAIEDLAIKLFERLGYQYFYDFYAPNIAPDSGNSDMGERINIGMCERFN